MKKIYLLFITILIGSIAVAQNPVPNPGFENWSGSPLNPDGWYSNGAGSNVLVIQAPGNTGSFAAQGNVINFATTHLVAPYLGCNFPVTQLYNSMEFFFKANLDSGDVLSASIGIYDTANTFLALAFTNIDTSVSTFTHFTLNIDSVQAGTPDHALIVFTIIPSPSDTVIHAASYFVVDDIELLSPTSGINENKNVNDFFVYPNPASKNIFIHASVNENKPVNLLLTDVTGNIVSQKLSAAPFKGEIADEINIETISPGIYFLRLIGEKGNYYRKILVR